MSDEEVREWLKRYYPSLLNNLKFGRELFTKMEQRKDIMVNYDNVRKKIGELKEEDSAEVEGVVAIVKDKNYLGCGVCKRKDCRVNGHEGKENYFVQLIFIGDDTGEIWCSRISKSKVSIGIGDIVKISGRVKKYKDNLQLYVNDLVVKMSKDMNYVVENIRIAGGVSEEFLRSLCKEKNVDFERVITYLKKDNDGKWRVNG